MSPNTLSRSKRLFQYLMKMDFRAIGNSIAREINGFKLKNNIPFKYEKYGTTLVCFPDCIDSTLLYGWGGDVLEIALLQSWLRTGDTFVDIGANLGLYTFIASQSVGSSGKVLAFEANNYIAEKLLTSRNFLERGNVEIRNCAVSDFDGEVDFWVPANNKHSFTSSLSRENILSDHSESDVVSKRTPCCTLLTVAADDKICKNTTAVKIDVEGAEVAVLRGTPPQWLDGTVLWQGEVNIAALANFENCPRDLLSFFSKEVFHLWIIPQSGLNSRIPRTYDDSNESFSDSEYYNFFAIPRKNDRTASTLRLVVDGVSP